MATNLEHKDLSLVCDPQGDTSLSWLRGLCHDKVSTTALTGHYQVQTKWVNCIQWWSNRSAPGSLLLNWVSKGSSVVRPTVCERAARVRKMWCWGGSNAQQLALVIGMDGRWGPKSHFSIRLLKYVLQFPQTGCNSSHWKSQKIIYKTKAAPTLTFLSLHALQPALDFLADLFDVAVVLNRNFNTWDILSATRLLWQNSTSFWISCSSCN